MSDKNRPIPRKNRDRNAEKRQVYVGNLPFDATHSELMQVFSVMGPVQNIWMAKRPPGFAFVLYKRAVHAYDAATYLNKTRICDLEAVVEICDVNYKQDLIKRQIKH